MMNPKVTHDAPNAGATDPSGGRLSELALAEIVDATPTGMIVVDSSGTIQLANAEVERMFGHPRGALLGQSVESLLPQRYREGHFRHIRGYLQDPQRRAMGVGRELYAMRADASEFPVEIALSPVSTSSGVRVIALIVDISERRRLEAAFQVAFEAAPTGMVMVNADGAIQLANRRLGELFGYAVEELSGRPISLLLPERHRANHPAHVQAYLAAPSLRAMGEGRELSGRHRDGSEFPVEIGLNPVTWGERRMVIAAVSDISKRKQLELGLRQANAQLEEFSYVASHDLRSPLRGISDLVDWVVEDLAANPIPSAQKNLNRIKLRVERMESIIGDLLTYARSGRASAEFVDVEPGALIAGVIEVLSIPERFDVHVECDVEPFKAAKTPLETVLRNLISNAVKHHAGEVGRIDITARARGGFCYFSVRDDGPGVPTAAHGRIFKLFQTVSAAERGGSGIGLAVCKRLVESHGGSIEVTSGSGDHGA
ncbi:MAG TPA: PAS domain-containing sensor histidine kinase, partial [Polyangiaceae bacterium]|nr:PAS domain-containing sensor histidine kinase [Polyangiaceae bacterium]